MSTSTVRNTVSQPATLRPVDSRPLPMDTERMRSAVSRLFNWYRNAVSAPATDKEKEEWQQDSF